MKKLPPRKNTIKALLMEGWSISWPMSLIMFFIFLIGIADVYIAGVFGKEIKSAYGLAYQFYFIFLIVAMALSVGSVSVISKLYTSGKREDFIRSVNSSYIVSAGAGFLFTAIGLLSARYILMSFQIPASIKRYSVNLAGIYFAGILFHYIIMNTNGILRACKQIKKSLWTMAVVCITNVVLNFILSFHTRLSYRGIAVSTVISLFVGGLLNSMHVRRLASGGFSFSSQLIKKIISISWPAGLLQLFWQMGMLFLFAILSRLPENRIETIAAFTTGLRIESAIFLPAFAFNMANAALVGNFIGKNEYTDAFKAGMINAATGVFIVTLLTIVIMAAARPIASLLSQNDIVIDACVKYIHIALLFEPVMAWGIILAGGLNGAGDTKTVMFVSALTIWLLRIPLSYILGVHYGFGAVAVWWSMNFSVLIQSIFITKRYMSRRWLLA